MLLKTELLDKNFSRLKSRYINLPIVFGYSLLTGLTAVYCVLLWYGAGLWWTFFSHSDSSHLPLLSRFCIAPLPLPIPLQMIHWQLMAIFSLLICIHWGIKSSNRQKDIALPIAMHILWIFFAVCCHLLGALIPMVMIGHIII